MTSTRRTPIPVDVKQLVLHEAGYRCGNPACRMPLTLEIHHLDRVADGGGNEAWNLLCLCPNCHTLHHNGVIPTSSLKAWKHILLSLNEAFDRRAVDVLLALHKIETISLSGDGLLTWAGLFTSGLIELRMWIKGPASGHGTDICKCGLSEKGKRFVEGWLNGDQVMAVGASEL